MRAAPPIRIGVACARVALLLTLVALPTGCPSQSRAAPLPGFVAKAAPDPVEAQAVVGAFLAAVNAGNEVSMRAFLAEHMSSQVPSPPAEERIARQETSHELLGAIEERALTPTRLGARVRATRRVDLNPVFLRGSVASQGRRHSRLDGLYGYGFVEERTGGVRHYGHGGALPGANAYVEMLPERGYTVVVLANEDLPEATWIGDRILAWLVALETPAGR